tara:strand:+ start:370 stop:2106 length:1737 start_codon:yes stop_codon:yes gene_type:complete
MQELLITTAIIEDLGKIQKVYLLSNWCNSINMQKNLENKTVITIPYHWKSKDKFEKDYQYLNNIYEKNLKYLSNILGEFNKTSKDIKYWRIIIGPWLRQFSDIVFDRYSQIKKATQKYDLYTNIIDTDKYDFISDNFNQFYSESKEDLWNHNLIGLIWKDLGLSYKTVPKEKEILKKKIFSIKFILKNFLNRFALFISKRDSYFFHNTNIPYSKIFNIYKRIRQIPLKTYEINEYNFSKKILLRNRQEIKHSLSKNNEYENILSKLISIYLPRIYLEDFQINKSNILKILPINPKKIFTTHSYLKDDLFKIWVAEKRIQNKSEYYIIQHGGCIRLCKIDQEEDHFIQSSDGFISWGWQLSDKLIIDKLPSLQLDKKVIRSKKNGDILIILATYPRYFYIQYSVPISDDYLDYINNIEEIYKVSYKLNNKKVKLRFDREVNGWDAERRLRKSLKVFKKDNNNLSLLKSLRKYKLAICTANSTVFLQTLCQNFPTLLFIDLRFYEIRDDVFEDFKNLNNNGICFFDKENLLKQLSKINNNINQWWFDYDLQSTRKEFIYKYANCSDKYENIWLQFINKVD